LTSKISEETHKKKFFHDEQKIGDIGDVHDSASVNDDDNKTDKITRDDAIEYGKKNNAVFDSESEHDDDDGDNEHDGRDNENDDDGDNERNDEDCDQDLIEEEENEIVDEEEDEELKEWNMHLKQG